MSKRLLTVAAADPRELAGFLAARLGLSDATAGGLIADGAVWVDGRRATATTAPLRTGQRVTAYVEPPHPQAPAPAVPVVYSDEHLLVVDKPAGLPSQPGRRGGPSLLSLLPGPLFLVHRLDAEASGLLVLARDRETAAGLGQLLGDGKAGREYVAVVAGRLPHDAGDIDLPIGPAGSSPTSPRYRTYPPGSPAGQAALSHYQVERYDSETGRTRVRLRLSTGRTHQLRVHLAALGAPIVGDRLYGDPTQTGRLLLHAARLRFVDPVSGTRRDFESPPGPELEPGDAGAAADLVI